MALCFMCFQTPGAFQTKHVLAQEVSRPTDQGYFPSKWKKSPKSPTEWTEQEDWKANVAKHVGGYWFICENCYRELKSYSAEQDHWSEPARATSVGNADALGRPRRSVLTLAIGVGLLLAVGISAFNSNVSHTTPAPVLDQNALVSSKAESTKGPVVQPSLSPTSTSVILTPTRARKVTLKTAKTIYPDSGGTKKIVPGTELKVIASVGSVMTVELNGQTFNVSKSEIVEHP